AALYQLRHGTPVPLSKLRRPSLHGRLFLRAQRLEPPVLQIAFSGNLSRFAMSTCLASNLDSSGSDQPGSKCRGMGAGVTVPLVRFATALIRIHDCAQHDATLLWRVIAGAAMHCRPLVPDQEIAGTPGMIVNKTALRRMRGQLLNQWPGVFLLHAHEAVGMHRVDEQDRAAGDRVVNDRRARLLVIFLLGSALVLAIETLAGRAVGTAMQPCESGEALLHCGR